MARRGAQDSSRPAGPPSALAPQHHQPRASEGRPTLALHCATSVLGSAVAPPPSQQHDASMTGLSGSRELEGAAGPHVGLHCARGCRAAAGRALLLLLLGGELAEEGRRAVRTAKSNSERLRPRPGATSCLWRLLLRAAAATPCVPAEDLVSLRLTVGSGESKQQMQPLHSYAYSEVPQQLALPARPLRACAPAV